MDVRECAEALVCVQFDEKNRHRLLHLVVVLEDAVDSLRDVIHHYIKVYFILFVTLGVKGMLECDDIWVLQLFHDLQLSVLISFVLVHLLNSNDFTCLCPGSLPLKT